MKKLVLILIAFVFLFTFTTFSESNQFSTTRGHVTVEKNVLFTLVFNLNSVCGELKGKNIELVHRELEVVEYKEENNQLYLFIFPTETGFFKITDLIIENETYPIGDIEISVVDDYNITSNNISTGVYLQRFSKNMTLSHYNIKKDTVQITINIALDKDNVIEKFYGIQPKYYDTVLFTNVEVFSVDGALKESFQKEGYFKDLNLNLEKDEMIHVTYLIEDNFDNYILQPQIKLFQENIQYIGLVSFI